MRLPETIEEAAAFLRTEGAPEDIDAAVILGSGLGTFVNKIEYAKIIPYHLIPHFPVTTVHGHEGELIFGTVANQKVIAFAGRFHHYEGFTFEQLLAPVYIAKALIAQKLIISNAAGAVNESFNVGDLVIVESVLRQNLSLLPKGQKKFHYTHEKTALKAEALLEQNGFNVKKGTYLYCTGPNYETKAEIRAFRKMGADTVGMSTAPELFEAARLGLEAVAISLITNMAAGIGSKKLKHEEVKTAAEANKEKFAEMVKLLITSL